jgi:hypothetical protein
MHAAAKTSDTAVPILFIAASWRILIGSENYTTLASRTSALGRYCRKKIFWTFPSNNDSREEPNTQYRIETFFVLIRLLRYSSVLRTFSTASVKSGKARLEHLWSAYHPNVLQNSSPSSERAIIESD